MPYRYAYKLITILWFSLPFPGISMVVLEKLTNPKGRAYFGSVGTRHADDAHTCMQVKYPYT